MTSEAVIVTFVLVFPDGVPKPSILRKVPIDSGVTFPKTTCLPNEKKRKRLRMVILLPKLF